MPATRAQAPAPLDVIPVQGSVHLVAGAGANIAVQVGSDGVVVVDAGNGERSDAVIAAVRQLSDQPIRYVINTSAHADHVAGNEAIARAGRPLVAAAGAVGGVAGTNAAGAVIIGSEAVLARMSAPTGSAAPYPVQAWPVETFPRRKAFFFNGEGIEITLQPAAHSDGDALVFFRRSDVVVAGELVDANRFPWIDVAKGGTIQGTLDALNHLVELAIPSTPLAWQDHGTRIMPARGRLMDQADLVEYRDMATIVRDVVQSLKAEGMTLEQVIAAAPAKGYERRFGATSGPWTTDMFIEAIYRTLPGDAK
ncbi:MAG: MBL fold metallo-hydrolase [Vicinamibacterales bacterium]